MKISEIRIGKYVIGASAVLAFALLLGRASGFLREVLIARIFGVSVESDLLVVLLTLPDLLVQLVLTGGLSAVLVPRLHGSTVHDAGLIFRQVFLIVVLVFSVFAVLLTIYRQEWFRLLAAGIGADFIPSMRIVGIALVSLPLTAAAGVAMSVLIAEGKFFLSGIGTLVFNTSVIFGLLLSFIYTEYWMLFISIGMVVGGGLRLGLQLARIKSVALTGPVLGTGIDFRLVKGFLLTTSAAISSLLVPLIVRSASSLFGEGFISVFNYATKIVALPLGVLISSVGVVAFSKLSYASSSQSTQESVNSANESLLRIATNSVGSLLLFYWFAPALVSLLFGSDYDSLKTDEVVQAVQILCFGLPFIGFVTITLSRLNALERFRSTSAVLWAGLAALPFFIFIAFLLEDPYFLYFSVVASQIVQAIVAVYYFKVCEFLPDNSWRVLFIRCLFYVFLLCTVIIFVSYYFKNYFGFNYLSDLAFLVLGLKLIVGLKLYKARGF